MYKYPNLSKTRKVIANACLRYSMLNYFIYLMGSENKSLSYGDVLHMKDGFYFHASETEVEYLVYELELNKESFVRSMLVYKSAPAGYTNERFFQLFEDTIYLLWSKKESVFCMENCYVLANALTSCYPALADTFVYSTPMNDLYELTANVQYIMSEILLPQDDSIDYSALGMEFVCDVKDALLHDEVYISEFDRLTVYLSLDNIKTPAHVNELLQKRHSVRPLIEKLCEHILQDMFTPDALFNHTFSSTEFYSLAKDI